jgi:hypothetical protein
VQRIAICSRPLRSFRCDIVARFAGRSSPSLERHRESVAPSRRRLSAPCQQNNPGCGMFWKVRISRPFHNSGAMEAQGWQTGTMTIIPSMWLAPRSKGCSIQCVRAAIGPAICRLVLLGGRSGWAASYRFPPNAPAASSWKSG